MALVAVAVLAGAWCGVTSGWALPVAFVIVCACFAVARRSGSRAAVAAGTCALLACAIGSLTWWSGQSSPLTGLARERAVVSVQAVVTGDPLVFPAHGFLPQQMLVPVSVRHAEALGTAYSLRQPASLLLGDGPAPAVGQTIELTARTSWPTDTLTPEVRLQALSPPVVVSPPTWFTRQLNSARDGLREAMEWSPPDQAGLVPGLVVGDVSQAEPDLVEAFRVTSLSHLTAVSGTNLTLMVVFLVAVAKALGARGWWLRGVTAAGVVLFVALCRTEPSVLRAAAMGMVGLAASGLSAGGRGLRQWGVAVAGVCLVQPQMSHSWGFAMSAAATAGILWWSPRWSQQIARWAPRWVADMLAVPLAAQLATQPLVTAINAQVSLVGVFANICAAPFVGPVTVLGLIACLLSGVWHWAASAAGWLAGWCSQPIILAATWLAAMPRATLAWGTAQWGATAVALVALGVVCWLISKALPAILKRWWSSALAFLMLGVAAVVPLPSPGWPGPWAAVFCDVGQGDASVLSAGNGTGVLVDAGPDPVALRRCLDQLGVRHLVLVVFSHEHADHVDGAALLARRVKIDLVLVRAGLSPPEQARLGAFIGDPSVPIQQTWSGQVITAGAITWLTISSGGGSPALGGSDEGEDSAINNASTIGLVQVQGLRLLFTGDAELQEQQSVAAAGIRVDVLKVAHHGSPRQDAGFLAATGAAVAVISVGANNGYGHPAASTVNALRADGMAVYRTDQCGGVSVVRTGETISVRTQRRPP